MSRPAQWAQADLKKALEAVEGGMGKRAAARTYGIPWGTLINKLSGRRKIDPTSTPQTYLTPEEEEEIVTFIKKSTEMGFGKTKGELLTIVKEMLDFRGRQTKWADNMPTDKWYRCFKSRHPQIVHRAAQKLGKQRAFVTKDSLMEWFETFKTTITSIDSTILLDPSRIYNCDESGFSLDPGSGRVLAFAGTKFIYQIGSEQKTMITVLVCCSGSGHFTWPMLIYPGSQFRGFRPQDVFQDSFITNSPNGWTNMGIFADWLESVFIPQTSTKKKPVLLLVDGHISHQSIRAASLCRDNGINLYALPPHSSHVLQPLDVGVFKTLKAEWRKAVRKQNEEEIITKRLFANVFKEAYNKTAERDLCSQAFRCCGLYPFDPKNVSWEKVLPAPSAIISSNPPAMASNASSETVSASAEPTTTSITSTEASSVPATASSASSVAVTQSSSTAPSSSSTPGFVGPSTTSPGSTRSSTLRKFAMICSQIGEATVLKYYERLEEGYDCDDPLYHLWKSYHDEMIHDTEIPIASKPAESTPTPKPTRDPLSVNTLTRGTAKRKVKKLPSLISGPEFIDHLIQKDLDAKAEEERKAKRKVDLERRRQEKAAALEEMQKIREEKAKLREETKKKKREELEKRKEERIKRRMDQNKQKGGKKKRKTLRQCDSDNDTSVDDSVMVLDDNSDQDIESLEELLMNDTAHLDEAIEKCIAGESNSNPNSNAGESRSIWSAILT